MAKYSTIRVKLSGTDGNAFALLGRVSSAMRKAEVPKEEIDVFYAKATNGDYDHLLQTCLETVSCE